MATFLQEMMARAQQAVNALPSAPSVSAPVSAPAPAPVSAPVSAPAPAPAPAALPSSNNYRDYGLQHDPFANAFLGYDDPSKAGQQVYGIPLSELYRGIVDPNYKSSWTETGFTNPSTGRRGIWDNWAYDEAIQQGRDALTRAGQESEWNKLRSTLSPDAMYYLDRMATDPRGMTSWRPQDYTAAVNRHGSDPEALRRAFQGTLPKPSYGGDSFGYAQTLPMLAAKMDSGPTHNRHQRNLHMGRINPSGRAPALAPENSWFHGQRNQPTLPRLPFVSGGTSPMPRTGTMPPRPPYSAAPAVQQMRNQQLQYLSGNPRSYAGGSPGFDFRAGGPARPTSYTGPTTGVTGGGYMTPPGYGGQPTGVTGGGYTTPPSYGQTPRMQPQPGMMYAGGSPGFYSRQLGGV